MFIEREKWAHIRIHVLDALSQLSRAPMPFLGANIQLPCIHSMCWASHITVRGATLHRDI